MWEEMTEHFAARKLTDVTQVTCNRLIYLPDEKTLLFLNSGSAVPVVSVYSRNESGELTVTGVRFGAEAQLRPAGGRCEYWDKPEERRIMFRCVGLFGGRDGTTAAFIAVFVSKPQPGKAQ